MRDYIFGSMFLVGMLMIMNCPEPSTLALFDGDLFPEVNLTGLVMMAIAALNLKEEN